MLGPETSKLLLDKDPALASLKALLAHIAGSAFSTEGGLFVCPETIVTSSSAPGTRIPRVNFQLSYRGVLYLMTLSTLQYELLRFVIGSLNYWQLPYIDYKIASILVKNRGDISSPMAAAMIREVNKQLQSCGLSLVNYEDNGYILNEHEAGHSSLQVFPKLVFSVAEQLSSEVIEKHEIFAGRVQSIGSENLRPLVRDIAGTKGGNAFKVHLDGFRPFYFVLSDRYMQYVDIREDGVYIDMPVFYAVDAMVANTCLVSLAKFGLTLDDSGKVIRLDYGDNEL